MKQLEDAVKRLGLRGAQIGGSVDGEDFSDRKFHPVWAKAEELGAVLFIHPQSTPELASRFKRNGLSLRSGLQAPGGATKQAWSERRQADG